MALTDKQEMFIEKYLTYFNATQAALDAGYSPKTARSIGAENLTKPDIAQAISQRLSETAMSADEVLMRLAEHARGNIGGFVEVVNGTPIFDFQTASEQGKMHLVKKLKTKTKTYRLRGDNRDDEPVTEVDVEFELYDAQAALVHIGKHHGLFVDRTELTGANGEALHIILDK